MSTQPKNNDNNWPIWVAIVVLFAVGLWPIAVFLLIREIVRGDRNSAQATRASRAHSAGQERTARSADSPVDQIWKAAEQAVNRAEEEFRKATASQKTASAKQAAAPKPSAAPQRRLKFPTGNGLIIAGAIVSGVFALSTAAVTLEFLESLMMGYFFADELVGVIAVSLFLLAGLIMIAAGMARKRKGRRWRSYHGLIGTRRTVSVTALAKAAGVSRGRVVDDLQDMLSKNLLSTGYLDLSRDLLVLSADGIPDEEPAAPKAEPTNQPEQDDDAILREIRAVNDAIPDPVMSAKIDRIGTITAKILDYQRRNPGKDAQLRSFLNYYLPTTLKILKAYAQLDAQGVEGENITAAKERIEGMMDKVVEGFETQLDKLFADRAMDISSDVSVLEQMLEKDGLSNRNQGMTL